MVSLSLLSLAAPLEAGSALAPAPAPVAQKRLLLLQSPSAGSGSGGSGAGEEGPSLDQAVAGPAPGTWAHRTMSVHIGLPCVG